MGTCIALHAASRCDPLKEPVILIEKDRLGAGSSGRVGAIVHQEYQDREMAGMARDALKVYAGFEQTTGRSIGYRQTGVLALAGPTNTAAVEQLEATLEMQKSIGINVRRVEAEEIRRLVPGIEVDDNVVGAFETGGGFVDAERTISAFATLARNRGAVTRIGVKDPTVLVEDGRAVGVETSAGTFYAPQVVLATGAWTPKLLRTMGVELPLRPVRTLQHFIKMPAPGPEEDEDSLSEALDPVVADFETRFRPDPFARMPVAHPVIFDHEAGFYAKCEPKGGHTRVGRIGFTECDDISDPEAVDAEVTESFRDWARSALEKRIPKYKEMVTSTSEVAWITLTPDERPIVGPIEKVPGLYVVAGFSGNDFQLAPSIGEGVAQMLWDQPVSAFDPEFLSPARFGK